MRYFPLLLLPTLLTAQDFYDLKFNLDLVCPFSNELMSLIQVIPSSHEDYSEYQQWKSDCLANMQKLTDLIESDQLANCNFSITLAPHE